MCAAPNKKKKRPFYISLNNVSVTTPKLHIRHGENETHNIIPVTDANDITV